MLKVFSRLKILIPALILIGVIGSAGAQLLSGMYAASKLEGLAGLAEAGRQRSDRFERLIELQMRLEKDVLQVQESLTDISATRGLDGLDDGPKLAAEAASAAHRKMDELEKLAPQAGVAQLATKMATLRTRFDAYYSAGRALSEAYVAGGPAAGNPLMEGFDKTSSALQEELDASWKTIANLKAESEKISASDADRMAADHLLILQSSIAICAFTVVMGLAVIAFTQFRVVFPLSKMTGRMLRLAEGDLEEAVCYVERRDEIGDMARSVLVFQETGKERLRLQGEMEESRRREEGERLERAKVQAAEAANLQSVVENLGAGLARLAECNIRMTIDDPFDSKFEVLRHDFNTSIAAFQATLEEVLASTGHLTNSSAEMQEASSNLAKRTEQQAVALEQTSAALEEITATVKQSAAHMNETRDLVHDARACTTASAGVVNDAIGAMKRIEETSSEIGTIIGVIDQIAFQTNLLALNAGVEAARAGDAGKGFAVVAQEVRELAQRSAGAAKQIEQLISTSSAVVKNGVHLVGETGEALRKIESFVSSINEKVDALTSASHEQSIGISEVQAAVASIDKMTQQNAAMVEESSAISIALAQSAAHLAELVKRFKLNRRTAIREAGAASAQPLVKRASAA